jgi:hypothetical protein
MAYHFRLPVLGPGQSAIVHIPLEPSSSTPPAPGVSAGRPLESVLPSVLALAQSVEEQRDHLRQMAVLQRRALCWSVAGLGLQAVVIGILLALCVQLW